ncbi:MAG TPA: DUF4062 domain-containing protein [Propionibacteriaceae bacterium]|nr:DUF4062 domain-containing protein [Propionibacteriaceae bacterium]
MEKREQVFVSSTFLDLQEERQAVIQTLLEADCLPAGMELFPASDDEKWDLIRRVIDDSDYYLVVIGARYGSTDDSGLSFTEKEFDYANEIGKPIMGFIHGKPEDIPAKKIEIDEQARRALAAFVDKVERRMVKRWTSPSDLAGAVALSLIQLRKTHPAEGWVRAGRALTPEIERELADLRAQVAQLEREAQTQASAAQARALREELAAGDDPYELLIYINYWSKDDVDNKRTYSGNKKGYFITVVVKWNDVIRYLGPHLMIEASEVELARQMDFMAKVLRPRRIPDKPEDWGKFAGAESASDAVHEVLVQFFSLGLVVESARRHQVTDKNKYWSLTAAGREAVTRVLAQRKAATAPQGDEGADADEPAEDR